MWAVVVPVLIIQVIGVCPGALAVHKVNVRPCAAARPTFRMTSQAPVVVILPVLARTGIKIEPGTVPV